MLFDPDVRAMIRLLGDLSGSEAELVAKRPALLAQLCELIDGDRWLWSLERIGAGKRQPVRLEELCGPRDSVADGGPRGWRCTESKVAPPPGQRPLRPAAGNDRGLTLTVRQIHDDLLSSIHIARDAGRAPFGAREINMARIILSEIPWLHEQHPGASSQPTSKGLAPRERAVFIHWVDGLSSRAIADKLRLSPYTVQDYIKGIYKHYRVNCRAELLKQMTLGWEQRIS